MTDPIPSHALTNAVINRVAGHPSQSLHDPATPLPAGLTVITSRILPPPRPIASRLPAWEHDALTVQLRGSIAFQATISGQQFQGHAHPGSCYIMPRGEPSTWMYESDCDLILIQLSPSLLAQTLLHTFERDPARVQLRPACGHTDPLLYGLAQALFNELHQGGTATSRIYLETLRQTLLVHMLQNYTEPGLPPQTPARGLPTPFLRQVVTYIETSLGHDLSLGELAALVHLSPYHFARSFKQAMGQSVHQYVIARRLALGQRLLLTTHAEYLRDRRPDRLRRP